MSSEHEEITAGIRQQPVRSSVHVLDHAGADRNTPQAMVHRVIPVKLAAAGKKHINRVEASRRWRKPVLGAIRSSLLNAHGVPEQFTDGYQVGSRQAARGPSLRHYVVEERFQRWLRRGESPQRTEVARHLSFAVSAARSRDWILHSYSGPSSLMVSLCLLQPRHRPQAKSAT